MLTRERVARCAHAAVVLWCLRHIRSVAATTLGLAEGSSSKRYNRVGWQRNKTGAWCARNQRGGARSNRKGHIMLKGKTAIVTGSTSGIGLGIARKFAGQGCNLMLNGFGDAAQIEATRAGLATEFGIGVGYSAADMSKPDDVKKMVADTESQFGACDILVNNAGIQHTASVEDFPDEKWHAIIAINLSAAFFGIKAALPGMQKRGYGRIINVASVHGLVASVHKSAYVAAKHAIVGLTKVVALENAERDLTCNAICPGWVLTPLVQKQIEDKAAAGGITVAEATKNLLEEKQPSLRFATPEDMGDLACFLASAAGRSITGIAIPVDGGWTSR
jgi:3-hydroxybutyrate dehydrogenase